MREALLARGFREETNWYEDVPFTVNSFKIDKESKTIRIPEELDTKCVKVHNQHINATIVSLFTQTPIEKCDVNPIVCSLKEKYGWKFDATDKEISDYVEKVIAKYDFLNKKFDALINLDYDHSFTARFKQELENLLQSEEVCYDLFMSSRFDDYEDYYPIINENKIDEDFEDRLSRIAQERKISSYLGKQERKRKFVLGKEMPKEYLKYLWCASGTTTNGTNYVSALCNKDIVVIDNESLLGEKIPGYVIEINRIFYPKSITVIKLF